MVTPMNKAARAALVERLARENAETLADIERRRQERYVNEDYVAPAITTRTTPSIKDLEDEHYAAAAKLQRHQQPSLDAFIDVLADLVGDHTGEVLRPLLTRITVLEAETARLRGIVDGDVTSIRAKHHVA